MTLDNIFSLCSFLAMIGWVLLAVLPRWKHTRGIVLAGIVTILCVVYATLIVIYFGTTNGGGFGSLDAVMTLFQSKPAVLAGWVHYLAFDLFIGTWEVQNAQTSDISHWVVLPCLFLTFMFGPIGLLLYLIVRTIRTRQLP